VSVGGRSVSEGTKRSTGTDEVHGDLVTRDKGGTIIRMKGLVWISQGLPIPVTSTHNHGTSVDGLVAVPAGTSPYVLQAVGKVWELQELAPQHWASAGYPRV